MRRTGRTTILILETIAEFYRQGNVVFIDHPRDDGKERSRMEYESLIIKFVRIFSVCMNMSEQDVRKEISFKVIPNGLNIYYQPDRMIIRALKKIGE